MPAYRSEAEAEVRNSVVARLICAALRARNVIEGDPAIPLVLP